MLLGGLRFAQPNLRSHAVVATLSSSCLGFMRAYELLLAARHKRGKEKDATTKQGQRGRCRSWLNRILKRCRPCALGKNGATYIDIPV